MTLRSSTMPSRGAVQVKVSGTSRVRSISSISDCGSRVVQQPLLGAAQRCGIALEPSSATIFRRRRRDRRAVEPHQRLALADLAAGGDILDGVDEGFGAHRNDRDAPLVELDGAGRAHRLGNARAAWPASVVTPMRCILPGLILTDAPSSSSPS